MTLNRRGFLGAVPIASLGLATGRVQAQYGGAPAASRAAAFATPLGPRGTRRPPAGPVPVPSRSSGGVAMLSRSTSATLAMSSVTRC